MGWKMVWGINFRLLCVIVGRRRLVAVQVQLNFLQFTAKCAYNNVNNPLKCAHNNVNNC